MTLATLAAPAAADTPSLRLIAADGEVRVNKHELIGSAHLGLWVAATGGEFRVHVRRPGYGRWEGAQVDPQSGAALRAVPEQLLAGPDGFARFLELRFLRRSRQVARHVLSFCPGLFERVSDDGPRSPTYSGFCNTGFPFALGAVWGVDRGWAGAAAGGFGPQPGPSLNLRPGRYRVEASIRAPFRRLFAIPPDQATARLRLQVERGRPSRELPIAVSLPAAPIGAAPAPPSAPTVEALDAAALPDLAALPPWSVGMVRRRQRDLLRFAGTPWNVGPAPLVVEGYRRPGEREMEVVQYLVGAGGEVAGRVPAGRMAFHAAKGHDHWHFLQFVSYRILRPSGGEVVRSRKQSFCLASTDAVDLTVPGARRIPDFIGLGLSACGDGRSIWIRQTLPAGWGDTYPPRVAGQRFDVTGLPNGRYILEMRVNPLGELKETTDANNVAQRRIVLRGKRGERRVRVAPWHGIRR